MNKFYCNIDFLIEKSRRLTFENFLIDFKIVKIDTDSNLLNLFAQILPKIEQR